MSIQHSSRSDQWFTPPKIIRMVREVLGHIDFDPASSWQANVIVEAGYFLSEDSLNRQWGVGSIYLNPPGGKVGNKSQVQLFWSKLMRHRLECQEFQDAIFMAFSAEALQNTQGKGVPSLGQFPFCIPAKRIKFIGAGNSPSHSNIIAYIPGYKDRTALFEKVFKEIGVICNV